MRFFFKKKGTLLKPLNGTSAASLPFLRALSPAPLVLMHHREGIHIVRVGLALAIRAGHRLLDVALRVNHVAFRLVVQAEVEQRVELRSRARARLMTRARQLLLGRGRCQ